MHLFEGHIAITFGIVLAAALVAGMVADLLRLPKVTAYLLVGVVLGPSVFDWLAEGHVRALDPLTKLAIGLVLFSLGCHFPLAHVRRILRRVLRLSAGELTATFLLVSLGFLAIGQNWTWALLLGALALATAPATTVLVLKESESEGPVTEYVDALVILNNVASILVFEFVFLAIHVVRGEFETPLHVQIGMACQDIAGSLALGAIAGLLVSYACGLVPSSRWLVLLVAATTFLLGAAEILKLPYMLGFLAMGLTVANASDQAPKIVADLDRLTGFLCVVFFVIHGAQLDLSAFVQAGFLGGAYIVLRSCGKYFGIFAAAHLWREPPAVRNWLGTALVTQAGAAIALSAVAADRDPALGGPIQTIILGTVVVFEIAGPLLIRYSVLRAGEVPLASALHHTSSTPWEELRALWTRLLIAVGHNPARNRKLEDLTVADLVRKNVPRLDPAAGFDEVISLIEHSHDNTYAVVDGEAFLVGIIRYADLSHAMFDRSVASLVRATDLASPAEWVLGAEEPAMKAFELFRTTRDDCIPVLARQEPSPFVGVVRRRDVMRYLFVRQK